MTTNTKKETIKEFLKRGGTITKCPPRGTPKNPVTVKTYNRSRGGRIRNAASENTERQIINANYRGRV